MAAKRAPDQVESALGGEGAGGAEASVPTRVGRKRDHSRDVAILEATLDVLAEVGYAGLTIDLVASRAKAGKGAVYRRWSSKEEMVLEAVARTRPGEVSKEELPDTGTLRGDLLALFKPQPREETERRMKVMAALASMVLMHPDFDAAVNDTMVASWADSYRVLMRRAAQRGEISTSADIDTIADVIPSVAAYRALIQRRAFESDFLTTWIDGVILPALMHGAVATED
ncbi:TetR/AcrR family transcriptional regulator [Nocardioides aurantiacus]|uniref:TetR family transcriptional regulator n=1 Tax=Nocardioides aurantiacus TaxID=86796 RepID=A0A3N2CTX7_9ACTN|nr:TetR/AcrR family transcriptional regulator [Nocardioides aurantiacus]ROR90992.1 TetR family transcriptional regulator [Nocardioides aurantiacus]